MQRNYLYSMKISRKSKKGKNMSQYGYCPDCDERLAFQKKPALGKIFDCPECGASLEVIDLNPIELTWANDDVDDYGDYDDEYEYDFDD